MPQCTVFSNEEIDSFRHGGKILRACLEHMRTFVAPGKSLLELDAEAENFIRSHDGAVPGFKGYHGFPGTLCTSVNEACVHGIPTDYVLTEGDIVSVDCGVLYDELNTDACITVPVGEISKEAHRLLQVTEEALQRGLSAVRGGGRVGDVSSAVQTYVEKNGCKAIRSLTGHGLGHTLHEYPDIPNVGDAGTGPVLPAGTVIAIEPIVSLGGDQIAENKDGWTIVIKDGSLSAHFENSILVTEDGFEIIA